MNEAAVPSLERALTILETLSHRRTGLTLSELARELELPKSSVHLIVRSLERRGYLQRSQLSSRFQLGLRLVTLSQFVLDSLELPQKVRPFLQDLVRETQLTAHMGVLSGNEAVLIDKVPAPGLIQVATWVGRRMAIHCTALGKALAAYVPEQQIRRWVLHRGLLRHNVRTIATLQQFQVELAAVRQRGYSVDDEEEELGVRCIGAPVFDGRNQLLAAISISGSKAQIPSAKVPGLAAAVQSTAALITESLDRAAAG